ncbi:Hepatocyte growth factor-regulated tyrosine kinase substrate [Sarcoptes scabiei]|uniref:Hepatocyte growth factor-regulated tyrosine kinase substrate n=1 Tax=Sarcoptes scabiei TaxID=52283 RepID=A0A834R660_SARSC|nr:Hepatocyte growth factor-regulated tyrosine kinase substrate [Sarcoptes scabiei]
MFKSSAVFDKNLEKATSLTNLESDWNSILRICDCIRQNDIQPRQALNAIKKKLNSTNPNVQLMALQVLESCVKNCGSFFHIELATKEFMEEFHMILKNTIDNKVKNEILRLVQCWAHAFRKEPSYKAVQDEMRLMKAEGFQFPALKENDAMFYADSAPEWSDGEHCNRCRLQFTLIARKHHCRNCGQVFCAKCSSKTSTIPKFGIEKEVRVCDVCFDKLNKKIEVKTNSSTDESKHKNNPTDNKSPSKTKTEQEIQEEEELQLALALSKSEAENRERMHQSSKFKASSILNSSPSSLSRSSSNKKNTKSSSSKNTSSGKKLKDYDSENDDPELARYLNREYWEQRTNILGDYEPSPSPSAPISKADPVADIKVIQQNKLTNGDSELDNFAKTLHSTLEIFVNRLNSNKLRGRAITNDSGVQALFMNLTNMHSHLMMYMQQSSEARSNCERLQDKINQIRDARAALDALREEHREQLKRAAEEAERIRQIQMAQKLEIMRKKKQEYLEYQRELAIQRMQEQEREMMMRTEQIKFASGQNANLPMALSSNHQWNITQSTASAYPVAETLADPNKQVQPNYYVDNLHSFQNTAAISHVNRQPVLVSQPPNIHQSNPIMNGQTYSAAVATAQQMNPQTTTATIVGVVPSHSAQMIPQTSNVPGHAMVAHIMPHFVPITAPQVAYISGQYHSTPEMMVQQYPTNPTLMTNVGNQQPPSSNNNNQTPQQPSVKEELLISFD